MGCHLCILSTIDGKVCFFFFLHSPCCQGFPKRPGYFVSSCTLGNHKSQLFTHKDWQNTSKNAPLMSWQRIPNADIHGDLVRQQLEDLRTKQAIFYCTLLTFYVKFKQDCSVFLVILFSDLILYTEIFTTVTTFSFLPGILLWISRYEYSA